MNGAARLRVAEALVCPATLGPFSARKLAAPVFAFLAAGGPFAFADVALAQDVPVITVEPDKTFVTEGEEALFTLRRAGPVDEALDVTIELTTTGSLPFSGDPTTVPLVVDAGSRIHSYGLVTENDSRDEADRTVTVTVLAPTDTSYQVGSPSWATVIVKDDDDTAVEVATSVVDGSGVAVSEVDEDVGTVTIRLTATTNGSVAPPAGFTVAVSTRTDTASSPDDYGVVSSEVPFAVADFVLDDTDNTYSVTKDVSLTIVDDAEEEDRETLGLVTEMGPGTPQWVSFSDPRIELTIVDNDGGLPEVTFSGWTPEVIEGEYASFTLVRKGPLADPLTVLVDVSETGSMISGEVPTSVVFPAGADYKALHIATVDDDVDEPDSVITVTITAGEDETYVLGDDVSLQSTVTDNDVAPAPPPPSALPEVTITAGPTPITEGADATFVVNRTGSTEYELPVSVEVTETGSMIDGRVPESVVIAAGKAETTLTVTTAADDLDEAASTITATVTGGEGLYDVGLPSAAAVVVEDDDEAPPPESPSPLPGVTITAGPTPVTEGTDVTFVVGRTGSVKSDLSVSLEVTETGSMIDGAAPESVVIAAGEAETTLTVKTVADDLDEAASTITATVTGEEGLYDVGAPSSASVIVEDDDEAPPVISVPAAPKDLVAVAKGQGAIDLSWAAPSNDGSSPITGYGIEWSPDGLSGWIRLADTRSTLTTYSDVGIGAGTTRYYRVCAMNAAGTGPVSNVAGATTKLPPPDVTIRAANGPIVEGAEATFVLRRTGPAGEPLTVYLDVAHAESTINGRPPESAEFPAGVAETMLRLSTVDDSLDEPDREITVTLREGDGYTLGGRTSATIKVRDNDTPPLLSVAGASGPESAMELAFQVSLEGRTSMPVRVAWSTSAGTASADADYDTSSGSLTIDPGMSGAEISVALHDDALYEEDETFTVSLRLPENARLADGASSAVGVIENDDTAPVLRVGDTSAPESAGELAFTVTLGGESSLPATVRWATSAGTAEAGLDYVEAGGTLTFQPGMTSGTVAVELVEDLLHEGPETLHLVLSEPTNARFEAAAIASATGTIEDDDDAAPAEAWLARFGRTAADHAVAAVEDRLTGRLGASSGVTVAGHRIDVSGDGREHRVDRSDAAPVTGLDGTGQAAGGFDGADRFLRGRWGSQTGRYGSGHSNVGDLLARSSFHFSSATHRAHYGIRAAENGAVDEGEVAGPHWSVWGRGAATRFSGDVDGLSLHGDVTTGTVGADFEAGRVLFGIAVAHSRGSGGYRRNAFGGLDRREGDVTSDLTTGLPYAQIAVNDRLSVWGVLGGGRGSMTLAEGALGSVGADIDMSLGAFGARHELRQPAAGSGFSLALRTDLLFVHTTSDETAGLPSLSTDVSRLRLMVESARRWRLESGAQLTPSVELGLRYDDGDAETGGGLEAGAGLRYESAARGLTVEITGRSVLTHESSGLSERGVAGSLRFEPGGGERGLSVGVRSAWGAASSGIARLWHEQRRNASPNVRAANPGTTAEADVGYAVPVFGGQGALMPYVGARLSERSGAAWRTGARLRVGELLGLEIEGARVERAGLPPSVQAALLASLRW